MNGPTFDEWLTDTVAADTTAASGAALWDLWLTDTVAATAAMQADPAPDPGAGTAHHLSRFRFAILSRFRF